MKRIGSILLVLLLMLTGCSKGEDEKETKAVTYTNTFDFEYEIADMSYYNGLSFSGHAFKAINVNTVIDLIENKGTAIVYFASPTCSACQVATRVVNDAAMQAEITVYYINANEMDDEGYDTFVQLAKEVLTKDDLGNPQLATPDLMVINSGEILGNNIGIISSTGDLTQEEYDAALTKFYDLIKKVAE